MQPKTHYSVSNMIGYTKVTVLTCMSESTRMVSCNIGGKIVCLPTQRYGVPSGCVGKNFVSTLTADLDGIQALKWNVERVIIFQTVILRHARLVTGAKNI